MSSFVVAPQLGESWSVPGRQPELPRASAGDIQQPLSWAELRFDIASPHPEVIGRST
jgi:hypothetical protein